MFQVIHRPTKIKFAMELKRKRSVSSLSSNLRNPKRRATPVEDSPLARLFNDVGIKLLGRKIKHYDTLVQNGKMFLFSLQGLMNDSPEECANDIYDKARKLWEVDITLMAQCTYTIDEEPSFSDTLVAYANNDAPEQRMASMMKDPWLEYILGDRVLGLKQSYAFIRGFLSILIAYWNMKDLLDKKQLLQYGRKRTPAYIPPINENRDSVTYAIDHAHDFQNLREVLESKYSSDPELVASLFEQISNYQVRFMRLADLLTFEKRAMITICLYSEGSCPLSLCGVFSFSPLEEGGEQVNGGEGDHLSVVEPIG